MHECHIQSVIRVSLQVELCERMCILYNSHTVFFNPYTYPIFLHNKRDLHDMTDEMKSEINFRFLSLSLSFILHFFHRVYYSSENVIKRQSPSCPCMLHIPVYLQWLSSLAARAGDMQQELHLFCLLLHRGSCTVSPSSSKGESVT